jgi:hypothetical protein
MQTYTFGQCARLLGVDPKVFRRWVREDLGLQEEDQVSRADGRVRYLTREQLERLAELHERALPAADLYVGRDERPDTRNGAYKLLADRLDAVEHELREEAQRIERLVQLAPQLEQLPAWMAAIEARLEPLERPQESPTSEQSDKRLAELEAQHRQQVSELEARYQQQIAELQAQLAARSEAHPSATGSASTKTATRSKARPLPRTLASRSAFAALHHVPDSVVARACNSGKIAATSGKWLYKSRIIFQALGERGQQDFYRVFHARPDFTSCKQCPHEIKEG